MEEISRNEQILFFNPNIIPTGLLSSKSFAEFNVANIIKNFGFSTDIKNRLSQKWQTVSQFTYVNMFSNTEMRQTMAESLDSSFPNMIELHAKHDIVLFNKEVKYGLEKRFEQNPNLYKSLQDTKKFQLIYDNKDVATILEEIRLPKNYLYNSITNKFEVKTEVAGVLFELEKAFSSSNPPLLDDYLPYDQVKLLYPPKFLYRNLDVKINDINSLVKIAKLKAENNEIVKNIEKFKTHMLNVFLDYILEKQYSYIPPDLYETAKSQQLSKEPVKAIELLKKQLYEIYLKHNDSIYDEVFNRLTDIPKKFTINELNGDDEETLNRPTLELQQDSPFLPQYEKTFIINGKNFQTVLHYAYFKLIENLRNTFPMQSLDGFDINTVPILDLVHVYTDIKKQWIEHTLKFYNEIAISAKLETYLSFKHLLVQTKGFQLIWNDITDPILGIGDGSGQNLTGNFLMFKRDEIDVLKLEKYKDGPNLMTNLYMYSMALEYRNTLLLLEKPNLLDLETIYGKIDSQHLKLKAPSIDTEKMFRKAGLTIPQQKAAQPLIFNYFEKHLYVPMNEQAEIFFNIYLNETVKPVKIYMLDKCQYQNDYKKARDFLLKIVNTINLAPGVTKDIFVNSILCGKQLQEGELCEPVWSRVYKWSHLFFADASQCNVMENKDVIKLHYNTLKDQGKEGRKQSKAINIRNANNFIKLSLIKQYAKKGGSVLDLGCGKGGDLLKYASVGILEYVGVDIADVSIEDAKIRYNKLETYSASEFSYLFKASFVVQDAYCNPIYLNKEFDLISSQFSFHYAFYNDKCIETAVENISKHLKPGGHFIATIPSKDVILERIEQKNTSNQFYNIEAENIAIKKLKEYKFSLIDSVNNCIEYFIDFDKMFKEFTKRRVMLVDRINFIDYYRFKNKNQKKLTKDELDVVGLYEIVVFRKRS